MFMNNNKIELLPNRGKDFGPKSIGAICPRALCQQFSHITLSAASLWSRHGCSSNAGPEWRPGTENSGWREKEREWERCNLSSASALMWAKASQRLQLPCPLWSRLFCPFFGGLQPTETSCWRKKTKNSSFVELQIVILMHLMGYL